MTKNITFDYGALYETVARQLSIIGKRSVGEDGKLLFTDITIGTRERDIIGDFFTNAFVDLTSQLTQFVSAEQRRYIENVTNVFITFWTNQAASTFEDQITANGQLLYNYETGVLYSSVLAYPFVEASPEDDTLFKEGDNYYVWDDNTLTLLTAEEVAELTEEEKEAAIAITYTTDPEATTVYVAGIYLLYNGVLYVSERDASFEEVTMPANAIIIDPQGRAFVRSGNVLEQVFMSINSYMDITLLVPDNWNAGLQLSLEIAMKNYCIAYALHSWFTVTAPRISEKYLADAQRQIAAMRLVIHEKKEPITPVVSYSDINGQVTQETT